MVDTLGSKPLVLICKGKPLVFGGPTGLDEVTCKNLLMTSWDKPVSYWPPFQYSWALFLPVLLQLQLRWRKMFLQGLKIGHYLRRKWLRWNFPLTASWRIWQEQLHWLQKWTLVLVFFNKVMSMRFPPCQFVMMFDPGKNLFPVLLSGPSII